MTDTDTRIFALHEELADAVNARRAAEQYLADAERTNKQLRAASRRQNDRLREEAPSAAAWDRLKSEIPRLLGRERVEDLPHDSEYATALHDVLAAMKRIEPGRALVGEES
ncbi:hypothetical protein ABZ234_03890 [Nocardiopsis sp. NPDC006198]|uniref:hypothetical protein n=1 Tax=Nocardiopsis sp. NPDC006198 TaxID=3154472 RepID=UPI0033B56CCA